MDVGRAGEDAGGIPGISCPIVIFYFAEPDVDAVSALYLKKVITEAEYESTLVEQKEQWAFVPQEEKK